MIRYAYLLLALGILARFEIAWTAPPVHLQTSWGSLKGGAYDVPSMVQALDSPLSVTDNQGSGYTITRFRFSYRQKVQYQNDSTGQVDTSYTLVSREFRNTDRLDTLWSNSIRGSLGVGDSFTIDNIIVRAADGRKLLAPGLAFDLK